MNICPLLSSHFKKNPPNNPPSAHDLHTLETNLEARKTREPSRNDYAAHHGAQNPHQGRDNPVSVTDDDQEYCTVDAGCTCKDCRKKKTLSEMDVYEDVGDNNNREITSDVHSEITDTDGHVENADGQRKETFEQPDYVNTGPVYENVGPHGERK